MLETKSWWGYRRFSANFIQEGQAGLFYTFVFMLIFVIFFTGFIILFSGKKNLHNLAVYGVANIIINTTIDNDKSLNFYEESGKKSRFKVSNVSNVIGLVSSLQVVKIHAFYSAILSVFISIFIVFLVKKYFFNYHEKHTDESRHLRGGEFVESEILADDIKKRGLASDIMMGDLPVDKTKEGRHFMLTGDTGTGKSQQIMAMLDVIRKRGKKVIIWDKSGEFIQHFYDPDRGDKILAPFDQRSEYWMPFLEGTELFDFERIAFSFLPIPADMDEGKKHWPEASITVFSWFLYKLYKLLGTEATPDDIFRKFIGKKEVTMVDQNGKEYQEKIREFIEMLEGTPAELVTDKSSPEHASSVIGSLIPKIRSFWYLRGLENKPGFSIRNWIKNDDETGWVFIRAENDQLESIRPLITAWLDTAISSILSLSKSQNREVWCLIDEMQSLDKLSALEKGLFEGRKHGLRMLLGFTSISKLNTIYGPDTVNSLISMCGNKMFFRISDDKTAERAARILLEKEVIDENKNMSYGTNDNLGTSENRTKRYLVTPSEIMIQEDMSAYVRLPGDMPTTQVKLDFVARPEGAEASVSRILPEPIDYSQSEVVSESHILNELEEPLL